MPTKKHAYAGLPPSENHASQGKNVRTNTRNSAFPRALRIYSIQDCLTLQEGLTRIMGSGLANEIQCDQMSIHSYSCLA